MTIPSGRGAQVLLSGAAQAAARGGPGTTLAGNQAAMEALLIAGTVADGLAQNGATRTGAASPDPILSSGEASNVLAVGALTLAGPIALSAVDSITAKASGTHADGTKLTGSVNNVSVVATKADAVILPEMEAGSVRVIINSGTADAQVFGFGTATINAVDTDTGVALAAGKTGVYVAVTKTKLFGGALA